MMNANVQDVRKVDVLNVINKLDSDTIRALIIATVPLLGLIAVMFGIDQAVFDAKAGEWTTRIMAFVTLGGVAWAAWSRIFKPTPPLSETAKLETVMMVADKRLSVTSMTKPTL
jgi:hypothetical protein